MSEHELTPKERAEHFDTVVAILSSFRKRYISEPGWDLVVRQSRSVIERFDWEGGRRAEAGPTNFFSATLAKDGATWRELPREAFTRVRSWEPPPEEGA